MTQRKFLSRRVVIATTASGRASARVAFSMCGSLKIEGRALPIANCSWPLLNGAERLRLIRCGIDGILSKPARVTENACHKWGFVAIFHCSPEASCPRKWAKPTGLLLTIRNLTFLPELADARAQLRKEGYGDGIT